MAKKKQKKQKKFRFGLQKKLVLLNLTVAIITYSTSAFFIFFVHPFFFGDQLPEWLSIIIVLIEGIIWSGILAYVAAYFILY